jgi:hypothetical protein
MLPPPKSAGSGKTASAARIAHLGVTSCQLKEDAARGTSDTPDISIGTGSESAEAFGRGTLTVESRNRMSESAPAAAGRTVAVAR